MEYDKSNENRIKASEYFAYKFGSCKSTRKLAAEYNVSNAYISKLLNGKMDDPSLAVATKLVKTFNLDKQIIHLLYNYKGEKFVSEVIYKSQDNDYSTRYIVDKFIECYFSDLDNYILQYASDESENNIYSENVDLSDKYSMTDLPGYNAEYCVEFKYNTTVEDTYTESEYSEDGEIISEREVPFNRDTTMRLTLFCKIYYLPTRQIKASKYRDDCIRDFINKFMYILANNVDDYNFVFFTTSTNTFNYIKQYLGEFKLKNFNKKIVLAYYSQKENIYDEYLICDTDLANYSLDED